PRTFAAREQGQPGRLADVRVSPQSPGRQNRRLVNFWHQNPRLRPTLTAKLAVEHRAPARRWLLPARFRALVTASPIPLSACGGPNTGRHAYERGRRRMGAEADRRNTDAVARWRRGSAVVSKLEASMRKAPPPSGSG